MDLFSNCSLFWLPTTIGTEELFPKIIRLDTWNAVLVKQATFFAQTTEKLYKVTFFEKLFPGKTLGHKECSDKAAICFLLKVRFCFARNPKNFSSDPEKFNFLNISNVFISETFLRAHRMELAQARLNVFP